MTTVPAATRYRLLRKEFCSAYIVTMRPYLLFVSGITGIAGMSLAPGTGLLKIWLIFLASFLSYGFGQALTDCSQIDTDSISSPYRPLTQGRISKAQVISISLTGLTFCIAVFSFYAPFNLILGIISAAGLATYTPFKRRWWGGPFYNSWIVGVLFLIAYFSAVENVTLILPKSVLLTLAAVFFGYANFVLSGYFKDISADRATGYNTLPVVFGRKLSAIVSDIFSMLAVIFTGLAVYTPAPYANASSALQVLLFFGAGTWVSINSQVKLHKVGTDEESHPAIALTVHAYILLLSAIAVAFNPGCFIYLILFYAAFNIVMKYRPSVYQV